MLHKLLVLVLVLGLVPRAAVANVNLDANVIRVHVPEGACDASCTASSNYDVSGDPLSTTGAASLLDPAVATGQYGLHDHRWIGSSANRVPAEHNSITYTFKNLNTVTQVHLVEHTNGIIGIEGFAGDDANNLVSVGNVVGSLGQGPWAERATNVFTFPNPRPGRYFRIQFTKTYCTCGYAMYRAHVVGTLGALAPTLPGPLTTYITRIQVPNGACDASCSASADYDVTGNPPDMNVGAGYMVNSNHGAGGYVMHDHRWIGSASNRVPAAHNEVTFYFDQPHEVAGLLLVEHRNGISRLEAFIGDDVNNLVSMGNIFGSLGDLGIFVEFDENLFQFAVPMTGSILRVRFTQTSSSGGYAFYRLIPIGDGGAIPPPSSTSLTGAVRRIQIPNGACDASCTASSAYDVSGNPFPTTTGAGTLINANPTSPGYVMHDHRWVGSSANKVPALHNRFTYTFDASQVVTQIHLVEHGNGIARIEGFAGDSENTLASVGNALGSLGDGPFSEGSVNIFTIPYPKPGLVFRVQLTRTYCTCGYAFYRAYPYGYATASIPPPPTPTTQAPAQEVCVGACLWNVCSAGNTITVTVRGASGSNLYGDGYYTDDSEVGIAAVHAGIVAVDEVKAVAIACAGTRTGFASNVKNGVTSQAFAGTWAAFYFVGDSSVSTTPFPSTVPVAPELCSSSTCLHNTCQVTGETKELVVTGTTSGAVYGTTIFTDDTAVGAAAVHAGALQDGQTGAVKVTCTGPRESFLGTTSNGVTSLSWGPWQFSYKFDLENTPPPLPTPAPNSCTTCLGGQCSGSGATFTVTVTGVSSFPVWGTDTYSDDSHVGVAAVHASLVNVGETATLVATCQGPQETFTGSIRNAVSTHSYGQYGGSFSLALPGSPPEPSPCEGACVHNLCTVSGSTRLVQVTGASTGGAWGTDYYTDDSSVQVAAVHMGLVGVGATATIQLTCTGPSASSTGSLRHGVTTSSFGPWSSSFTLSAP